MTKHEVKENIYTQMVLNILDNGSKISKMGKVNLLGV